MRIKELSIGDWVQIGECGHHKGSIAKVWWLSRDSNHIGLFDTCVFSECEDDVLPIPLTPEILEKNGFVKCGRCCTSRTTAYIKDFTFVNHLKERKAWRVKIYGEEGLVELCSILVHHTHQLQNALRLAGVGKEVEV